VSQEIKIPEHPFLQELFYTEPAFNSAIRCGYSMEECVVMLAGMLKDTRNQLESVQAIAPRKIQTPDGKIYVWHCPDELIPVTL
jgi:hypothetical protein